MVAEQLLVAEVLVVVLAIVFAKPPVIEYNGTAGAGDFWNFSVDHSLKTIKYLNNANGSSGSATFTVNRDGSYDLSDPDNNLTSAIELPGYQLLVHSNKGGANGATKTMVVGVPAGPVGVSSTSSNKYNYMQFRTHSGGVEVGYLRSTNGILTRGGWWPYGAFSNEDSPLLEPSTMDLSASISGLSSKTAFFTLNEGVDKVTVFGTEDGFLSLDLDKGSIVCMEQAESSAFDSSFSGLYTSLFYSKTSASIEENGEESGSVLLSKAFVTVTIGGAVTVVDSNQAVLFAGVIAPLSEDETIVGDGLVEDNCNGMFKASNGSQEFFVSFFNKSILFSSVKPISAGIYSYFYGAGIWNL